MSFSSSVIDEMARLAQLSLPSRTKIDWSDYPGHYKSEPEPIRLEELKEIQSVAQAAFHERQARRDRNELIFCNMMIGWINDRAKEIAATGFSYGVREFPLEMYSRIGEYWTYQYIRGFKVMVCGQMTYVKHRWSNAITPFEKVVDEYARMGIRIRIVSSNKNVFSVAIEWD